MDAKNTQLNEPLPASAEMFVPKSISVLREGYSLDAFRADVVAGLTVAIVALPLSMAIAIASGTTPDRGLYAAIFGGFLVSLLGGSRFQIGGPAGAFIVLVAASTARHGIEGVLLATMMAGLFLVIAGVLRIGSYIRYIPHPVTVGFTAGIAVIIFASQIHDLLGITLAGKEPGELIPKLAALGHAIGTTNTAAVAISLVTIGIIVGLRKLRPTWPGMLIAVALTSVAAAWWSFPVETIGTRFGGIPQSFPMPSFPEITLAKVEAVLPDAIMFAVLGAIEFAAVRRRGRRHDRAASSLQWRACRAGFCQYRIGPVRRHLCHRHHRAHRHQCPCRRAQPHGRHAAFGVPARLHAAGRTAGELYSAGGACGRACGGGVEHGGEARVCEVASSG